MDDAAKAISEVEAKSASPESPEYTLALNRLRAVAEQGHAEAAVALADSLAFPGPHHDPSAAYKWYYIGLALQGYSVEFRDENRTPPHYCGPVGDFRNESMVSMLIEELGFERIRELDAEAAAWLEQKQRESS